MSADELSECFRTMRELAVKRVPEPVLIRHSENLAGMSELLATHRRKFALVYMDPPFRTGKRQVGPAGSYEDPAVSMSEFTWAIIRRAELAWQLLNDHGCLVVHVDPKTSHYVKVELDKCLGMQHFASEIIWSYRRWPSKTQNFQRRHDVLLRYVKSPADVTWNQLYEPLAPSTLKTWGTGKQLAVVENGKRKRSSATNEPTRGVPMGDVWDIGIVAPVAKERTGYPTQKPEVLLERLVAACTNPGDLVLDPYLGSGTTPAVCARLGRDCIAFDENIDAVTVARKRLEGVKPC